MFSQFFVPTPTSQNVQSPEGDTIQLLAVQNTGSIEVQESGSHEGFHVGRVVLQAELP